MSQEHTKFKTILKGILEIRFVSNQYFLELRPESTTWVISGKKCS